VIVPSFNESANLPNLIAELRHVCADYDVVVIDDGSTDRTSQVASTLPVRLISLPCNLGIGGAVQTGLQYAQQHGYEIALQVDGDGQHPPAEIPKLLRVLREAECDLVIGSRFRQREGYQSTVGRRMGIRLLSWMISVLCHTTVTDATSGFRALSWRAICLLANEYAEDYPEVEAILMVNRAGLRIAEISVRMVDRQGGRSSIGMLQSISYMVKVPLAIFMSLLRSRPSLT
jgi:glycosyltransferase involved in cell wall biosynthesis